MCPESAATPRRARCPAIPQVSIQLRGMRIAAPRRKLRSFHLYMSVEDGSSTGATRREFLCSAGALAGAPLLAAEARAAPPAGAAPAGGTNVVLRVNGEPRALALEPRVTLLD